MCVEVTQLLTGVFDVEHLRFARCVCLYPWCFFFWSGDSAGYVTTFIYPSAAHHRVSSHDQ